MKNLLLLALLALPCATWSIAKPIKTKVVTLATIHGLHSQSRYSYEMLLGAVDTYKPDLICVEIRPEEFRSKTYLLEMMYATAYGDQHGIAVEPIDWYLADGNKNDRVLRDSLVKLDSCLLLQKRLDSLESVNSILQSFRAKFGTRLNQQKDLGFEFYNGEEYNAYNRECYRLSISVFGDSPINLSAVSRNQHMAQRTIDAIKKHGAKMVVVLTGAEHKSFMDDALRASALVDVLPACSTKLNTSFKLSSVISRVDASAYFTKMDSAEYDKYYYTLIGTPLLSQHLNVSYSNEIKKNLPSIKAGLQQWLADVPSSVSLKYSLAWYHFLNQEYDKASELAQSFLTSANIDKQPVPFFFAYRLLGFCCDVKNEREAALAWYGKGKAAMLEKNINANGIRMVFEKYEKTPFSIEE